MLNVSDTQAPAQAGNASGAALAEMSPRKLARQAQEIYDVILAAQRRRQGVDFTLTEVRDLYESQHGRRIDVSRVSARVSELIAAGRLVRVAEQRRCSVTGAPGRPVSVPAQQAGLWS